MFTPPLSLAGYRPKPTKNHEMASKLIPSVMQATLAAPEASELFTMTIEEPSNDNLQGETGGTMYRGMCDPGTLMI